MANSSVEDEVTECPECGSSVLVDGMVAKPHARYSDERVCQTCAADLNDHCYECDGE